MLGPATALAAEHSQPAETKTVEGFEGVIAKK
jgi:hypothetical protein